MASGEGHIKITLEITGGFTGRAGKRVIAVDLSQLPEAKAAELHQGLQSIPPTAWGASFFAPHPKPWDFQHVLQVEDGGSTRRVEFHRGQGPPELTRMAEKLIELQSES
jgi:hypothetical protein